MERDSLALRPLPLHASSAWQCCDPLNQFENLFLFENSGRLLRRCDYAPDTAAWLAALLSLALAARGLLPSGRLFTVRLPLRALPPPPCVGRALAHLCLCRSSPNAPSTATRPRRAERTSSTGAAPAPVLGCLRGSAGEVPPASESIRSSPRS
jgi:hypothetical protein